ncbi:hypothetical protein AAAY25_06720, partial [Brotaphodocola catenula]|uniref:hypothetical protein n=1 Tax=Brotaphodocola catenula TaxID=2885361 RepID=UPI0032C14A7E
VQSASGACYAPTAVERRCALGAGVDGCRSNRASAQECAKRSHKHCFDLEIVSTLFLKDLGVWRDCGEKNHKVDTVWTCFFCILKMIAMYCLQISK